MPRPSFEVQLRHIKEDLSNQTLSVFIQANRIVRHEALYN